MVKSAFQRAFRPAIDDDAHEIGIAVDAIDRGIGIEINDGYVLNDDLPGLGIEAAMDEKALVFVTEIIAEDPVHPVARLFDDEFRQVVVVHAGQFYVGASIPGPRGGRRLRAKPLCGQQTKYDEKLLH
jgi:hypothetical protein